jgi:3-methyladenine DNA glycosylase AlkD
MTLRGLRNELRRLANSERAAGSLRFFKTGPGEYGEGDRFLGVTVPGLRSLLPETDALREVDVLSLLRSKWHEERMLALFILVRRFGKVPDEAMRESLVRLYLANTEWINNWDLVDCSAPYILGAWLIPRRDRAVLRRLARSKNLWEQRIAIIATQALIREGQFDDALGLCADFLIHSHDLMHKACGWMLREVGKRDMDVLKRFLDAHAARMPRTMLRYSIEKLPEPDRKRYMTARARPQNTGS